MTLYSGQESQLLQGVSQQHPKDRAEGQNGEQVNCISDIVAGLRRRPGFKVLSELAGITTDFTLDDKTAVYSYSRGDGTEEYIMLFDSSGRMKIYDAFTGTAKTVVNNNAAYLTTTDPSNDLRFHTIGDTTFVLNTTKEVTMDATSESPDLGYEALVYCKRASYGHVYKIVIDGSVKAQLTTPATVTISTTVQNKQLTLSSADILDSLTFGTARTGWTITSYMFGSGGTLDGTNWTNDLKDDVLHMTNNADFQISVSDGNHGNDLYVSRNACKTFEDLPKYAPKEYKIEVTGTGDKSFDNYWVKWLPSSGSATNWDGDGVWKECVGPLVYTSMDAATLPTLVTRESDGSFENNEATWGSRAAGDDDTNPVPSFIDATILDIGTFQNRLFFLTGENVVMSRSHDHLQLFAESVAAPGDDDPIDSASSDNQITDLLHAAIFNGSLVLFSNNAQFIFSKTVTAIPSTFAVSADTKFNVSPNIKPVVTGANIMFPTDFGTYTNVWEYNLDTVTGTPQCESTTKHIPKYLAGNPVQMIANTTTDYVFMRTDADDTHIYLMQFYIKDKKRAQLAWHRWELTNVTKIFSITLLNQRLFALVERGSSYYLEYLDLSLPATGSSAFEIFADHWYEDQVTSGSWTISGDAYNARVPEHEAAADLIIQLKDCHNEGFLLQDYVKDGGYIYCNQPSGAYLLQGYSFTSSGTITNPYVKDQQGKPYTEETIIDHVAFSVQNTGYIEFTIDHVAGTSYTEVFNGMHLNHWQFNIGVASLLDTVIRVDVGDYRELVTINYNTDHHLGFSMMSMDWLVNMITRGRRSQ